MENNEIATIFDKSGFSMPALYSNKSSYPKNNAQENLQGRSYFATDESLKFFGARISSAHETASGLLFYVIESSFLNFDKTKRGFRFHLFDIFGQEVGKQEISEAVGSTEQARKAMYKFQDRFDITAHYIQKLESIAKDAEKKAKQAREIRARLLESEAVA